MMNIRFRFINVTFIVIGLSGTVFAQNSVNSHLFRFGDTLETIETEDALGADSQLIQSGNRILARASYDYVDLPLIAIDPSRNQEILKIVDHIHTVSLGGGFLVHPRVWVGLNLPIHEVTRSGEFNADLQDHSRWSLGDLGIKARVRITPDDAPVNVALMPYVNFPTGSASYLVSDQSYHVGARLIVDRHLGPVKLIGQAGYSYASDAAFLSIDRRKRVEFSGALSWDMLEQVGPFDLIGLTTEAEVELGLPSFRKDQNPLEMKGGFRFQVKRWIAFAGAGFYGLGDARSGQYSVYSGVKTFFGPMEAPKTVSPVETALPVSPLPVSTPIPPEPVKEIPTKEINLESEVYFEKGKSVLAEEKNEALENLVSDILPYASRIQTVHVVGHTDSLGSATANLKLSQQRAQAVTQYLVKRGIPEKSISYEGRGEREPKISPETSEGDRRKNRRVTLTVKETIRMDAGDTQP